MAYFLHSIKIEQVAITTIDTQHVERGHAYPFEDGTVKTIYQRIAGCLHAVIDDLCNEPGHSFSAPGDTQSSACRMDFFESRGCACLSELQSSEVWR